MINVTFQAAMAVLIAKFMFNDLPHAAGLIGYLGQEPPTTGQIRYIAVLCQQLGMSAPYEEQVRSRGEAGRMIRELEAERESRKSG